MSRSVDRMRQRRYFSYLDQLAGDAETTALATGGAGELLSTVGKFAAGVQAKQEADKKAAEDKKKADADKAAHDALVEDAKKKRAVADGDANAARIATLKAQGEAASYGPLHVAAQNAADKAAMSAKVATEAEAKAGIGAGALSPNGTPYGGKSGGGGFKMPTWGWVGIGVLGVGLLGTVVYKVAKK